MIDVQRAVPSGAPLVYIASASLAAGFAVGWLTFRDADASYHRNASLPTSTTETQSMVPPPISSESSNSDVVQRVSALRTQGNDHIVRNKPFEAMHAYQSGLDVAADYSMHAPAPSIVTQTDANSISDGLMEQRRLIVSNALLALQRLGHTQAVIAVAQAVLFVAPPQSAATAQLPLPAELEAKIRFRAAAAYSLMKNHHAAVAQLEAAEAVTGGANETVQQALKDARCASTASAS